MSRELTVFSHKWMNKYCYIIKTLIVSILSSHVVVSRNINNVNECHNIYSLWNECFLGLIKNSHCPDVNKAVIFIGNLKTFLSVCTGTIQMPCFTPITKIY